MLHSFLRTHCSSNMEQIRSVLDMMRRGQGLHLEVDACHYNFCVCILHILNVVQKDLIDVHSEDRGNTSVK